MKAFPACPYCGSEEVGVSRLRDFREKLRSLRGVHFFRCRHCGRRYTDNLWRWRYLAHANCPRCGNMELRDWSEKYLYPPWYKRWLRYVGAREQRCEACRHNFVSFRARLRKKKSGSK